MNSLEEKSTIVIINHITRPFLVLGESQKNFIFRKIILHLINYLQGLIYCPVSFLDYKLFECQPQRKLWGNIAAFLCPNKS